MGGVVRIIPIAVAASLISGSTPAIPVAVLLTIGISE